MVQRLRLRALSAGSLGLIPGQGTKFPHALEQPSLSATTSEPELREPRNRNYGSAPQQKNSLQREASTLQRESRPRCLRLEKALMQQ